MGAKTRLTKYYRTESHKKPANQWLTNEAIASYSCLKSIMIYLNVHNIQTCANAEEISLIKSSTCSSPTESRTNPSEIPKISRASLDKR